MPNNIQEKISTKNDMESDAFQVYSGESEYNAPDIISSSAIVGLQRWQRKHKHDLLA